MRPMRRVSTWIAGGSVAAAVLAVVVASAERPDVSPALRPESHAVQPSADGGPAEPHDRDIATYAEAFGLPFDEASRRWHWGAESDETMQALREVAPARMAAVYVEHVPEWRVVAEFTGGDSGLEAALAIAATAPVPVEIRTGAARTEAETLAVFDAILEHLGDDAAGILHVVVDGTITLLVHRDSTSAADPEALGVYLESRFGVSLEVAVVDSAFVDQANVYGGGHLFKGTAPECTAGFPVWDWLGGIGLVTAAHCNQAGSPFNHRSPSPPSSPLLSTPTRLERAG